MGDSSMVVVWPSRGENGEYNSVTLSQRKAPYEVMPTVDPHPPFVAKLSFADTWVTSPSSLAGDRLFLITRCARSP